MANLDKFNNNSIIIAKSSIQEPDLFQLFFLLYPDPGDLP